MKAMHSTALRLVLTMLAFGLLFWFVDLSSGLQAMRSANPALVAGGFMFFFCGHLAAALRWRWVLATQGIRPSFARVLRANMVGAYASMFLPGISGGDLVRPLVLSRGSEVPWSTLYATVAFERLMGMIVMLAFAVTGLMLAAAEQDNNIYVLGAALVGAGIVLFIAAVLLPLERTALAKTIFGRIHASLSRFVSGLRAVLRNRRALAGGLAFSGLFQLCMIGMYVLMLMAVAAKVEPVVMLLIPIAWLASSAPISINGLGVREGVLVFILVQHGVDQAAAAAAAVLGVMPMIAFATIGGLLLPVDMRNVRNLRKQKDNSSP